MKLRNKKTGEIIALKDEGELALLKLIENSLPNGLSLWEKVNEPLIKDEKVRRVVRAWIEVNALPEVQYDKSEDCIYSPYGADSNDTSVSISFDNIHALEGLKHRQLYTIAELCGEGEE